MSTNISTHKNTANITAVHKLTTTCLCGKGLTHIRGTGLISSNRELINTKRHQEVRFFDVGANQHDHTLVCVLCTYPGSRTAYALHILW